MDAGPKLKLVVGLGNPGDKYAGTRHNVGFDVLNLLGQQYAAPTPKAKFEGQLTSITFGADKLMLLWPLTYMNASGRCVKAVVNFYKLNAQRDVLVVCDDLSLPLGKLRMRGKGSAGGQKGLNDILRACGTQEIDRLRIGIDAPPPQWEVTDYVLGRFRPEEQAVIDESLAAAANAVCDWCRHDLNYCMNRIN